jgi:ubiquinone/menaquinone biosynthesis C-methylase UbiE
MSDPIQLQRAYYAKTAAAYDQAHHYENVLDFMLFKAFVDYIDARSVLDIGSGTGRALLAAKGHRPQIAAVGIEPASALREQGYAKGLSSEELIDGDAQAIDFLDNSFDLVCEFAALHHIPNPSRAVAEMLRVARKAVFISDSNNFGQGSSAARAVKQMTRALGLWPLMDFVKTRGRGYLISDEDGLSYSYSVFHDLPLIRSHCASVYVFGDVSAGGSNPYRASPGAVIVGLKAF